MANNTLLLKSMEVLKNFFGNINVDYMYSSQEENKIFIRLVSSNKLIEYLGAFHENDADYIIKNKIYDKDKKIESITKYIYNSR